MADPSKFVLRWALDDAAALFNTGKAYSGEYPVDDFVWSVGLEESADDDEANVTLRCKSTRNRLFWKCAGEVEVFWLQTTGKYELVGQDSFSFNETNKSHLIRNAGVNWTTLMFQGGVAEHKITLKLRVTVISSIDRSTSFFHNFKSFSLASIGNGASSNEGMSTAPVTDNKSASLEKFFSSPNEAHNGAVATDVKSTPIDNVEGSTPVEVKNDLVADDNNLPIFDISNVSSPTTVSKATLGAGDTSTPKFDAPPTEVIHVTLGAGDTNTPMFDAPPTEVIHVTLGAGDTSAPGLDKTHVPPSNETRNATRVKKDKKSSTPKFSSPNESSNVILVAGEKKLHVSKDYLAIHSPVFAAMFFGDTADKEKNEVEIEDVIYEELLDLLQLIFPGTTKITDHTLVHILKLASRFKMEGVMQSSEEYLIQSKGFDAATKMLLAEKYGLGSIRENWLQSFNSVADVLEKLSSPEAADFSGEMKIAICNRIMELNRQ